MKCTWLCVYCGSSILHSGRAGGGVAWVGLAYRSCSNASVRLTVCRGKLHLLPGIAVTGAWRYETASAYDRQHSDKQQLDLEREDYFRMRMLICV